MIRPTISEEERQVELVDLIAKTQDNALAERTAEILDQVASTGLIFRNQVQIVAVESRNTPNGVKPVIRLVRRI